MPETPDVRLLGELWSGLGGGPAATGAVAIEGPRHVLPSVFDVTALAAASVAVATLATAELAAARRTAGAEPGSLPPVRIDRAHAAIAFRRETYASPIGWSLPPIWDPIAGDYRTADGWIRLHTNYAHHRDAALSVLGVAAEREAVAAAVARRRADDLESAVVAAGGCAAAMRTTRDWAKHEQGRAVAHEPVFAIARRDAPPAALPRAERPLAGVRVLDLTRVIAGPVCTAHLAAYGADVLRIDPPGFAEVGALLPETTAGKRRAALDLKTRDGLARFEALARDAHVLVSGYRSDALPSCGLAESRLREINPRLAIASLDAYGWSGPWAGRRGFDSLVQMSSGIAARGGEIARVAKPVPLPAQALDHATGYLLAAAVCRALVEARAGTAWTVRCSLARTAALLLSLGESGDPSLAPPSPEDVAPWLESADSAWGPIRRVRPAGSIEGTPARLALAAGPLGADAARWGEAS
jgi:crotonobetainyl-CoA:carnitine CoA-transferase CaiB-like acyl-CoA transferase